MGKAMFGSTEDAEAPKEDSSAPAVNIADSDRNCRRVFIPPPSLFEFTVSDTVTGIPLDVGNLKVFPRHSQISLPATSSGIFRPFADRSTPLQTPIWPGGAVISV